MKTGKYILIIIFLMNFLINEDLHCTPPKTPRKGNSKTSCAMTRSKFTGIDRVEYRVGVLAGSNVSTFKSNSNFSTQDAITGLIGGVAAQVIWPVGFIIQPEVLYSQKGCMFAGNGDQYFVDYLEVPLKLMYRFQVTSIKPIVFAAPYWANTLKMTENGDKNDGNLSNKINKYDYGISAGAGFEIWKLQISFRYSWGLAQVVDDIFKVRTNTLTATIGIFFF